MDYLSFVRSYHYTNYINYLVSGNDDLVIERCLNDIINQASIADHPLIILDDISIDYSLFSAHGYQCQSGIRKDIKIYNPFHIDNIKDISAFRELLDKMGYEEKRKDKLISYLKFIQYLESLKNQSQEINIDLIIKYSSSIQVEKIIQELVFHNIISIREQNQLLSKYVEISEAGADFEDMLYMLDIFVNGEYPHLNGNTALIYSIEQLKNDQTIKRVICYLLFLYIEKYKNAEIIIFDKGYGTRDYLFEFISNLSLDIPVHVISYDFLNFHNQQVSSLLKRFALKIFCQHASMSSCEAIEKMYGQIDIVKNGYNVSCDRRFSANKPWDILMGKNKQEVYIKNAPIKEARYPKEMIFRFQSGMCLVDFQNNSSIFKL